MYLLQRSICRWLRRIDTPDSPSSVMTPDLPQSALSVAPGRLDDVFQNVLSGPAPVNKLISSYMDHLPNKIACSQLGLMVYCALYLVGGRTNGGLPGHNAHGARELASRWDAVPPTTGNIYPISERHFPPDRFWTWR